MLLWLAASGEVALKRAIGCWLITKLPQEALDDALHTLKDVVDFYSFVPAKRVAPPKPQPLDGVIAATQKRPGLEIGE